MLEIIDKEKALAKELQTYISEIKSWANVAIQGMSYVIKSIEDYNEEEKYKSAKKINEALASICEIAFSIRFDVANENKIILQKNGEWNNKPEYADLISFIISLQTEVCKHITIIETLMGGYDYPCETFLSKLSKIIDDYLNA